MRFFTRFFCSGKTRRTTMAMAAPMWGIKTSEKQSKFFSRFCQNDKLIKLFCSGVFGTVVSTLMAMALFKFLSLTFLTQAESERDVPCDNQSLQSFGDPQKSLWPPRPHSKMQIYRSTVKSLMLVYLHGSAAARPLLTWKM